MPRPASSTAQYFAVGGAGLAETFKDAALSAISELSSPSDCDSNASELAGLLVVEKQRLQSAEDSSPGSSGSPADTGPGVPSWYRSGHTADGGGSTLW